MSHHCHGESCQRGGAHAFHHFNGGHCKECSSCHCHSCCHNQECCGHHGERYSGHLHELLELADIAWRELLIEKMQEHIESSGHGKAMDEMVEIVIAANRRRWKLKMEKLTACKEFEESMSHIIEDSSHKGSQEKKKGG